MTTKKPIKKAKAAPKAPKMLPKHIKFVEEYLIDWNATRAYMAVYGTKNENGAGAAATRVLRKNSIKLYLQKRVDERNAELRVDSSYVVKKLQEVVESDYCGTIRYMTQNELDDLPKNVRKLIQAVKIKRNKFTNVQSGMEQEQESYEVKFMSKDKAIELLGKHTGTFMKDNDANLNVNLKGFASILEGLDV